MMIIVLNRNTKIALSVFGIAVLMLSLSFAAVPFYKLFCQIVGYGGATQKFSDIADTQTAPETHTGGAYGNITVRFDSNISPGLNWKFFQKTNQMEIPIGETAVAYYVAKSLDNEPTIAQAVFNVTPHIAGKYFVKIDCFCFEDQKLQAYEERLLPVTFYVDSAIRDDEELKNLDSITLSYTFLSLYDKPQTASTSNVKSVEHDHNSHDHGDDQSH